MVTHIKNFILKKNICCYQQNKKNDNSQVSAPNVVAELI
jgi:hypothetical protein